MKALCNNTAFCIAKLWRGKSSRGRQMHAVGHPISPDSIKNTIQNYLEQNLLIEFGEEIDENSDLFGLGLIDSYAYIETLRFLESEFKIEHSDEEILLNVTASLAGLCALVEKKLWPQQ
jgi:D-alanine--poly(phosphoribitol) ligase subunit 2